MIDRESHFYSGDLGFGVDDISKFVKNDSSDIFHNQRRKYACKLDQYDA